MAAEPKAAPSVETPEHLAYKESLHRVSKDISDSLRILAETKNAATLKPMTSAQFAQVEWQSKYVPDGYDRPITLNYTGPLDAVVEMVAETVGADVRFMGRRPIVEPVVRINSTRAPAIDILRNAGTQLGSAGEIVVMPSSNLIEVRFNTDQTR